MSTLRVRLDNSWIDSDKVGSVRYQGGSIAFGPSGAPDYERLNWIEEPSLTNASDGPTYNMGIRFTVLETKPCYGISWRVPDSVTAPSGGIFYASLYSVSPDIQIRKLAFTPTVGAYQDILFETPVDLNPALQYVVGVFTVNYVFRSAASVGGFPITSASGNIVADIGKLSETNDSDQVPGSNFASLYYVSPLVGT